MRRLKKKINSNFLVNLIAAINHVKALPLAHRIITPNGSKGSRRPSSLDGEGTKATNVGT